MSWTLVRSIARLYWTTFLGIFLAILVVYVVGDFADRLNAYLNKPLADIAELYWNVLLVITHQLAPAAMLLAAGATVSTIRKRGEWTAMQALGLSRWVIILPVGVMTLVFAVGLVAFDEYVVTTAGPKRDHLMAQKFNRYGDYRFFYVPRQWFRLAGSLVSVRGDAELEGTRLHDVTVYELDQNFHVSRRLDGDVLTHVKGSTWQFDHVTERIFQVDGQSPVAVREAFAVDLKGSTKDTFLVRIGRPEYMRVKDLKAQMNIRARVGLPTERLVLALHNRFAYPATGFAATMLAIALALRPGRRGHLTLALIEGLVVTMTLFGLLLVGKALVLGDHVAPLVAAWGPIVALLCLAGVMWWRSERDGRSPQARQIG